MIYYYNKKSRKVRVAITRHAVFAFQIRYNLLFDTHISLRTAENLIKSRFPLASRISNLSFREQTRVKRHGHSLFFRDPEFTYVVHNGAMKTVEISKKGFRDLN